MLKEKLLGSTPSHLSSAEANFAALILRLGLGSVFLIGGWWKLSRALDAERSDALVASYTADTGYINTFFEQYLFADGSFLTPLAFLTILSAFELISGIALLCGAFVRALSFIYAFLLWSFVIALPVVTAPGAVIEGSSYFSPALLVQIRDVSLSGMFFVLLALGSGYYSVDQKFLRRGGSPMDINWQSYGLLLRLSVAITFIVGGAFAGYDHIKAFVNVPILLLAIGLVMASGHLVRVAGALALLVVAWYCVGKFSFDASLWNNLNSVKREIAFISGSIVLVLFTGGSAFQLGNLLKSPADGLLGRPPRSI